MARKMRSLAILSVLALNLPLGAVAHMEMRWPYSFRSKFNPANTDPDYSNTSPLTDNGSNYPCKGYKDLPESQDPVVTYTPGQTYNLTLAGSATHGGGSCQISLSYDNGNTFHVIKSMIGGCPLKLDWDFTIPSYAPPSNSAILAWTWFNLIGNREMYMQCARVGVTGQAVQRYRRTTSKRQASIDELPKIFECNIGNGCTTLEMHEVVFPDPGNVVEYGTDAIGPSPGPGFIGNGGPTGSSAPSPSTAVTTTITTVSSTTTVESSTSDSTTASLSTSDTTAPAVTTPPYPYPNGTSPGGFYSGSGTGTGYGTGYTNQTRTRTLTITEFSNATTSLTLTSSALATTTPPAGGMFQTITIVSTLPPMPFLSGTTGIPTPVVKTITQIVPIMPFMPNGLTTASNPLTTFSTIELPTETTLLLFTTSDLSSAVTLPSVAPSAASSTGGCTPGSFRCDSSTSFSQCISTSSSSTGFISMGSVATGMQCVDDKIVRENAGACAVDGALQCDDEGAFYQCANGGLIEIGPVEPGMVCTDGLMVPTATS